MAEPLLQIENLSTHFFTDDGIVKAVDNVSLAIPAGKTVGLVGESGCGKSVTALSVIRLIAPPGKITAGRIILRDQGKPIELTALTEPQLRQIRGGRVSMIFQEPMTSLNPVFTVGQQIVEAIRLHQQLSPRQAHARAVEMLGKVNIPEPERRIFDYPHQFSGGMRQRVMIAMALACNPRLLIADEPTTALDVTIQAQILDLLRQLQRENGMSILIITHDLGVVAEIADEVAVMYASQIVEQTSADALFSQPRHPYTRGLFGSRPRPGMPHDLPLQAIQGMVPRPLQLPDGCNFHPRCPYTKPICQAEEPVLRALEPAHWGRCHLAEEIAANTGIHT